MSDNEMAISAFVLMQFDPVFDQFFSKVIEPTLAAVDCEAKRSDSDLDQRNIMQKIVEGIARADIVIAEITSLNPNVMYELGLAHGLNKPTIILTQDIQSAPFDLRSYTLVPYSEHFVEIPRLQEKLKELVRQFRAGTVQFGNPIMDFAPGTQSSALLPATEPSSEFNASDLLEEDDEQLGWLDLQLDMEQELSAITEDTKKLGAVAVQFTQDLDSETRQIQNVASASAAHKHAIVVRVAQILTDFATELESIAPGFGAHWLLLEQRAEAFFSSIELKSDEDRSSAEALVEAMERFLEQQRSGGLAIETAKESISSLRGISKVLSRAVTRTERALDGISDSFDIGESFANRIINVLRSRIEFSIA